MLFVHGKKVVMAILMLAGPVSLSGQINARAFDRKFATQNMHFGITLAFNTSDYKIVHSQEFIQSDSLSVAESPRAPGFTLGIVTNVHLGRHLDFRFLPSMSFAERGLTYTSFSDSVFNQSVESVNLELPFLLKYKGEPWGDVRLYAVGGVKYSYDLASNASARNAEGLVKVGRNDISIEYGIGIEIFFPMFILAPELRFSNGLNNVHSLDSNLPFSSILDKLFTRQIQIAFHFEG